MTDEDEINFILGNDDGTLFGNIDGDLPEDGELQLEPPSAPVGIIDDFQWHPAAEPADNGGLAFLQSHLLRSDHGAIADIVPLPQEHRVDRVAIYPDFSPRYNENGMKTKRMNVVTPPQDNSERWISLPSNWQQHAGPPMKTKRMNVVTPPQDNSERWISLPNNWQQHAGPPPQDLFEAIQFDPNSVDEWFGATPLQEQAVVDNGTSNSSNIHKNQPSRSNMLNHDNNCLAQQLRQIPLIQTMQSESHEQQKEFTKMGQQHLENPYLCNFPPIIHPPQLKQISPTIVPLRKRKLRDSTNRQQEPSHKKLAAVRGRGEKAKNGSTLADDAVVGVIPPEVKAKNARSARKLRRLARAKSHVIHLVGGGDITKIQRHAVKDSCLDNATTPVSKTATSSLQSASLLNYFFNNDFQPAMFVDMTLEWVQQTLSTEAAISGVHPKKGNEAAPIEAGSRTMDQGKGSELTSNLHPSTPFPKLQPMETPSSFGTCVLMNTPPRNKPAQA
eukprot:CAMPEP_0183743358 /NCGR_PEP_ID=MMETSP0737-20130205/65178_1 /TAXON_ID=385413 /ORGANISM="Thalassiosira miniscula, Strain CCMP1093" /LENGTH=500 /DNA_ID=CAMNT_0025978977 /DNA_START=44 /DNA_END=1542 /DNA_ORIENTATION=-